MIQEIQKAKRGYTAICKCDRCSAVFKVKASQAKKSKYNFCSKKCFDMAQSGMGSIHWKGMKVSKEGYIYIKEPSHPRANFQKYVLEHRLVMEKF